MTAEISPRLREHLVEFLDAAMAQGEAPTREAVMIAVLERESRRGAAERDVATLRRVGPADDLDDLVDWTDRESLQHRRALPLRHPRQNQRREETHGNYVPRGRQCRTGEGDEAGRHERRGTAEQGVREVQ